MSSKLDKKKIELIRCLTRDVVLSTLFYGNYCDFMRVTEIKTVAKDVSEQIEKELRI